VEDEEAGRGGPGRGRSQRAAGSVKMAHQSPTRKRTRRREKRVLPVRMTTMMASVWRRRAPPEAWGIDVSNGALRGEGDDEIVRSFSLEQNDLGWMMNFVFQTGHTFSLLSGVYFKMRNRRTE